MKNKKIKKYLVIVLSGGLLVYIISFFYYGITNKPKDQFGVVNSPPGNYINLFNKNALGKLVMTNTGWFSLRDTISFFNYDKKYSLELTKIKSKTILNFGKDIIEAYTKVEGSYPKYIVPANEIDFTTNYKETSTETASKIYLSLFGDSVRTILKNDSIACYYLKLKNVYVQYKPNGVYEIYIKTNTKLSFFYTMKQVDLMFLKRNNALYFLLLTANDDSTKLDPGLLYKLVTKE